MVKEEMEDVLLRNCPKLEVKEEMEDVLLRNCPKLLRMRNGKWNLMVELTKKS